MVTITAGSVGVISAVAKGVYLAGSIEGVTDAEAKGWRDEAKRYFSFAGIPVYDPTRRINYRDTPEDTNAMNRIVKLDLQDIAHSSVILADLRDSSPGRKWGTLMEVAHSHTKNKIIILLIDEGQYLHPFVGFYATEIHHSLENGISACLEYFT